MLSAISRRYAKALFDLADQENTLEDTRTSLEGLANALTHHEDLSNICLSPMFSRDEHWHVLESAMGRLGSRPLVVQFVRLLVSKHRLAYLSEITRHFGALVDQKQGREGVRVDTPHSMTDDERSSLQGRIEEALGCQVSLSIHHRPDLMAGLVIQVGSKVFDNSVRGRLNELRRTLSSRG